jgi:hypothetical protein
LYEERLLGLLLLVLPLLLWFVRKTDIAPVVPVLVLLLRFGTSFSFGCSSVVWLSAVLLTVLVTAVLVSFVTTLVSSSTSKDDDDDELGFNPVAKK